jgi:hypothetical protein
MAGARMGRERCFRSAALPIESRQAAQYPSDHTPQGYAPASFCVPQAVLRLPGPLAPHPGIARGRFPTLRRPSCLGDAWRPGCGDSTCAAKKLTSLGGSPIPH